MRRKTITKSKIIALTHEVLQGFYGRSIDHLTHYLSEDFIWIGAYDFQFATSKQEFLDIIQSELDAISFKMEKEEYGVFARDRDTFMLYCKFNLTNTLANGDTLRLHTRLSVIWKYIDNELKLIHIHGSNAQDIPTKVTMQPNNTIDPADDFIGYITTCAPIACASTTAFRLENGAHRVLSERDILYLQSEGQNTRVYTKDRSMLISGILQTHQKKLSDHFFRVHKSYLINTIYLTAFRRYRVTLCDKIELPIGKERYLDLKARYTQNK